MAEGFLSSIYSLYLNGDIDAVNFRVTASIAHIKTKHIMGGLDAFMNTLEVVNVVFQDILNREWRL